MSNNYYRIPMGYDMIKREQKLRVRIDQMDSLNPDQITNGFCPVSSEGLRILSPWDEFLYGTNVHIGKRSSGWKFLWNWNNGEYYKTKEELFDFIRSGRVVNEYGKLINQEQFIQMALDWNSNMSSDKVSNEGNQIEKNTEPIRQYEKIIDELPFYSVTEFF